MSELRSDPTSPNSDRLLAYVADLELEVDRLRRQLRFFERQATESLAGIERQCDAPTESPGEVLAAVRDATRTLKGVVQDLRDTPGYHPAHDQVVAVAVRPMAEQAFRWQQRLLGARGARLQLELQAEYMEWFPARLRHILDNLIGHALRHPVRSGDECCVTVGLGVAEGGYTLRVSDDGAGPAELGRGSLSLFVRGAAARASGLTTGLAVVRLLVEQSGGSFAAGPPRADGGAEVVLTLPRYDLLDYLD